MIISGLDHISLPLMHEIDEVERLEPNLVYFFNFRDVGIEIIKNSFSVEFNSVKRGSIYYHVVCYNWSPIGHVRLKHRCKMDKWNRKVIIGDFKSLSEASPLFSEVVKYFCQTRLGELSI